MKISKRLLMPLCLIIVGLSFQSIAAEDDAKDEIAISPNMQEVTAGRLRGTDNVIDIPIEYTMPMQKFFEGYIRREHARYVRCHSMIDIHPKGGTYGHNGYGNAFGAECYKDVSKAKKDVAVCADDMVGNFKEQQINKSTWTKADLIKFVVYNCIGG